MNDKSEGQRILSLSKLELAIGIAGGLLTLGTAYASFAVIPYRLTQAENAISQLQSQQESVRRENQDTKELLIRIDERLKTVQSALKLETKP